MSHKLPAMQFYVGDWKKDSCVQSLDYWNRGIWFELLLIMWDSVERGKLLLNGKPYPLVALSRTLSLTEKETKKSLKILINYGVARKDESGIIYNKRMVEDEQKRIVKAENGSKGGSKTQANAKAKSKRITEDEYEDEIKVLTDNEPIDQDLAFELSWNYYPERIGKKAAKRSFKATVFTKADWLRHVHAYNAYVDHVEGKRRKGQKLDWQNGSTWFNNWEDWAIKSEAQELEGVG